MGRGDGIGPRPLPGTQALAKLVDKKKGKKKRKKEIRPNIGGRENRAYLS